MGIERGKPSASPKERIEGFTIQFAMREQIAKTDSHEVSRQLEDAKTPDQVRALLPSFDKVKREEGRTTGDQEWLEALNVPGMTDALKEKIIDNLQGNRYITPDKKEQTPTPPQTELDGELARVLNGEPANAQDEINQHYLQIERDAKRSATELQQLGEELITSLGEKDGPIFLRAIHAAKRMGTLEEGFRHLSAMDKNPNIAEETIIEVIHHKEDLRIRNEQ